LIRGEELSRETCRVTVLGVSSRGAKQERRELQKENDVHPPSKPVALMKSNLAAWSGSVRPVVNWGGGGRGGKKAAARARPGPIAKISLGADGQRGGKNVSLRGQVYCAWAGGLGSGQVTLRFFWRKRKRGGVSVCLREREKGCKRDGASCQRGVDTLPGPLGHFWRDVVGVGWDKRGDRGGSPLLKGGDCGGT